MSHKRPHSTEYPRMTMSLEELGAQTLSDFSLMCVGRSSFHHDYSHVTA